MIIIPPDVVEGCVRDYIHVVDLAKAHVAALRLMEQPDFTGYDVFNIGTGQGDNRTANYSCV